MSCSSRILTFPTKAAFCGVSGNEDLYDLGIRLGSYLLWGANIVAHNVSPTKAESIRTLSSCYQLATTIGLVYSSTQPSTLFAVEAYILLALCIGGIWTSTYPRQLSSVKLNSYASFDVSGLGGIIRLVLLPASAGFGLWYTFLGMDNLCQSLCANDAFFFARVDLYGWYRTLLKVVFCGYAICLTALFGRAILRKVARRQQGNNAENEAIGEERERPLESPSIISLLLGALAMLLFILTIELTIYWNLIVDSNSLHSVAQLLPLLVALAGLCKTLYTASRELGVRQLKLR